MEEKKIVTIYDLARYKKYHHCRVGNAECTKCKLASRNNSQKLNCSDFLVEYPEEANEIILKWCDEHPQRTYKDDFLEKFPNAKMNKEIPSVCRNYVYGIQKECGNKKCEDCWNEVFPE